MPISVGEVETVLTARDNMSPALQLAAARVKELEYRIGTLGTTSVESLNVLEGRLAVAKERFDQLAAGGDNAGKVVGQSMAQAEGIALRLIERMAILYAIRGTFQFVTGLYEAADALVKMNAATDISIGMLQVLEYGADKVGIKFTQVTSSFDHLDKLLASPHTATIDALQALNLELDTLRNAKPDERVQLLAAAFANMTDKLLRTKYEVALFGTDAIDPLLLKLAQFEKDAPRMSDDTARVLSTVVQSYKQAWDQIKDIATEGFAWTVKKTGDALWALTKFLDANADPGDKPHQIGDIGLPNDAQNPSPLATFRASAIPPDYIDMLKAAAAGERALTEEQVRQLGILKELNLLTDQNAAALTHDGVSIGVNTEQLKRYQAAMKDMAAIDKELEKYAQAWERAQKQTDDLWTKSIEARNQYSKQMADLNDKNAKEQLARELKDNEARFNAGIISERLFYANKEALEYQYYQRHLQRMKEDEEANLQSLKNKEQLEMDALEERYAQGKIDEAQYQEQRLAIAERYAILREGVESQYLSTVRNMRLDELQKEEDDRKAALAKQKAADDAAAAAKKKAADMSTGNSMTYDLSTAAGYNYFIQMNPAAKIDVGPEYFKTHTLQEAIAAGLVDLYYGYKPGFGGSLMPGRAGFAEGGMVDITVGERGPEAMRVPVGTMVASSGNSLPSMGGAIMLNMNGLLLSTDPRAKADLAKAIIEAITPILRLQRKLGAA